MGYETWLTRARIAAGLLSVCALVGCGQKVEENLKPELTVDLGDGVTMDFVLVHPGSFTMGSNHEGDNISFEKPPHKVKITQPFYLGKYLVTQEQWQSLMGSNPSTFKGTNNPVDAVSWNDCQDFLAKLKTKIPGMEFCLPTEAQWEYACRAGSAGDYCYGDGDANLGDYAWFRANSNYTTHPVGEKKPNAWGLYDMHGNVWEWCADWHDKNYYASSPTRDPAGPATGQDRVARGGSYFFEANYLRSAFRFGGPPVARSVSFGLRVCLINVH
jgi:formylglycine-generating enzyme required for sulfatase activity